MVRYQKENRRHRTLPRFSAALLAFSLNLLAATSSQAGFFDFGAGTRGVSGLDFQRGYDVNTVATVSGRVTASPRLEEPDQYLVDVQQGGEVVRLCLGPASFWERKGIALKANDLVTAKGARAQGQDGKSYLLTQRLVNRSSGSQVELRNETGAPNWAQHSVTTGGERPAGGALFQGGGMLFRGGGSMMRH
ncbi:DNA-binding protein [Geomonas sp. Red32]|uniref:DNA-binding protein n=1 Tax=Geomonas sp. Red32 TaxID=2912856 RepID=UPI00202CFC8B|nr:DNA-binding protein [Geomonas sp. Red32]MCM0082202.1 DNA-binding protein [Geomonas sp. Red32]